MWHLLQQPMLLQHGRRYLEGMFLSIANPLMYEPKINPPRLILLLYTNAPDTTATNAAGVAAFPALPANFLRRISAEID